MCSADIKTCTNLIKGKKMLPFKLARFCTQEMKMNVVGAWALSKIEEGVCDGFINNVGIRYDEENRVKKTKEERTLKTKISIGKHVKTGHNIWSERTWGFVNYPLVNDKVIHYTIKKYWDENKDVVFPPDSNCVGCFHKPIQQLRKNWEDEPEKMEWFAGKEREKDNYEWKRAMSYDNIKKIGLQGDFNFGTGSGCQAGFCTD